MTRPGRRRPRRPSVGEVVRHQAIRRVHGEPVEDRVGDEAAVGRLPAADVRIADRLGVVGRGRADGRGRIVRRGRVSGGHAPGSEQDPRPDEDEDDRPELAPVDVGISRPSVSSARNHRPMARMTSPKMIDPRRPGSSRLERERATGAGVAATAGAAGGGGVAAGGGTAAGAGATAGAGAAVTAVSSAGGGAASGSGARVVGSVMRDLRASGIGPPILAGSA